MLILQLCQAGFGSAAVIACIAALASLVRHRRTAAFNVTLAGAFALAYFLCVPDVAPQLIVVSVLAIATGAVLMPSENQRSRRELVDDVEVGDSTATRRLK
jgi:hypothetical protein